MTNTDLFLSGDTPEPERWESGAGPWFAASFFSESSCCGGIEPGEVIRADGSGSWEHRDCRPDTEPLEPEPVCAMCFTVPSRSGVCLCD